MNRFPSLALTLALTFALSACETTIITSPCDCLPPPPVNLGDLKTQLLSYHDSGTYEREVAAVDNEAINYLDRRAAQVKNPAIVIDIDETALSNWPELEANDFGHFKDIACDRLPDGPCGIMAWQAMGRDEAIQPTLALFREAKVKGVAVFFITGRDEDLREATAKNLHAVGYDSWKALVMRPHGTTTPSAADYKAPERAKIEAEGYTIIVNVGDQPSDLAGGHAERAFLLPDPFYRIP